jgi:hypothetical protein
MQTDTSSAIAGRCTCSAVRYYLDRPPLFVHACHCRFCQRETGAAFAVNALIESAAVVVTAGSPEAVLTPSASGRGQTIVRCPDCRIAVWSHYAGLGKAVSFVRVGTLDDPDRWPPDIHIFTESQQPWVTLGDGRPAVPGYYEAKDHWPAASLRRLHAVLKPSAR